MLDSLTRRLAGILSGLRGKGRLTEDDVADMLREVRVALLEADVNFGVAKAQSPTPDPASRVLEFSATGLLGAPWVTAPLFIAAWSNTQVVAYTYQTAGSVRVRLSSVGWAGATIDQASPPAPFTIAIMSPRVYNATGAVANVSTTGGGVLALVVDGLAGATGVSVTVGGAPCQLLNAGGGNVSNVVTEVVDQPWPGAGSGLWRLRWCTAPAPTDGSAGLHHGRINSVHTVCALQL